MRKGALLCFIFVLAIYKFSYGLKLSSNSGNDMPAKVYFVDSSYTFKYYTVHVIDGISGDFQTKFKVIFQNFTYDYLYIKTDQIYLKFNDSLYKCIEEDLLVKPLQTSVKVVNYIGHDFRSKSLSLVIKEVYRLKIDSTGIQTPNFSINPYPSTLNVGGCLITQTYNEIKKDKATLSFEANNKSDKPILILPQVSSNLPIQGIRLKNDSEKETWANSMPFTIRHYANPSYICKAIVVHPGTKKKFDLTFLNEHQNINRSDLKNLVLEWNHSFHFPTFELLEPSTIKLNSYEK